MVVESCPRAHPLIVTGGSSIGEFRYTFLKICTSKIYFDLTYVKILTSAILSLLDCCPLNLKHKKLCCDILVYYAHWQFTLWYLHAFLQQLLNGQVLQIRANIVTKAGNSLSLHDRRVQIATWLIMRIWLAVC